ncbi:MAG TPA: hypothetical protein DCQ06_02510 [Myxococcales bacterium]|nr:hypothetical protein [Myxococcales bacterium]HAN30446.1 hypothetical protein [Myxococcales bacterium]
MSTIQKASLFLAVIAISACGNDDTKGPTAVGADTAFLPLDTVSPPDTIISPDVSMEDTAAPEPGTFGAPCEDNGDCDSGFCVSARNGKVCSQTCIEDCPSGFQCAEQKRSGGDISYVCVPKFLYLCDPCQDNISCNDTGKSGNVCVSFGNAGNFCGIACDEVSPDCPTDYSCQQVIDSKTGAASSQCVRDKGICECSARATSLGLSTNCTNKNLYGACSGQRNCEVGGLGACQALVPKPEECNAVDDDCDGSTDNFDASAPCKSSNEFGSCTGVIVSCLDGKTECDAPAAKPELCNGIDDDCDGETDEQLCDDGDPCTKDSCNTDGSCKHKELAGLVCDDGSVCTQTDKCISGKCIGGNKLKCDDNDPCTSDSCDPFVGCVHDPSSDAKCPDDGIGCTQDICKQGKCVHPQLKDGETCVDDGNGCTADICKAGKCEHIAANSTPCQDGNPCTINDTCQNGSCVPGPLNQCDDKKPCTKDSCNPQIGCVHSNNDFAPCTASSKDCPTGQCIGGTCLSKPNVTCNTKVKVSLCSSVDVAGTCTGSGKCVAKSVAGGTACKFSPNCKTVCLNCGIEVCLDFLFSS